MRTLAITLILATLALFLPAASATTFSHCTTETLDLRPTLSPYACATLTCEEAELTADPATACSAAPALRGSILCPIWIGGPVCIL